jgi:hypothetical protein
MLNSLSHWFTCNGLSLNVKKTKFLKFDTINQDNMPTHLKLKNELLHGESHIKFLGIEIDKSLNWKAQVKSMLP